MASEKLPPELNALISLLDDPDAEAFRQVSARITSLGPRAVPPLEAAWEEAFDPVMQKRIEDLVHQIQFGQLCNDFNGWASEGDQDLLEGYMLVSRYQYPDLNEMKVKTQLDHIVRDTWLELNDNLTSLEKVKVLNHLFFLVYKFGGTTNNTPPPENYFINILLESRMGTSLSIGILYLLIALRLGIPLKGVDLPQHFVVAFTNQFEDDTIAGLDSLDVQFYINPFAQGAVFSLKELNLFLKKIELEPLEKYYQPCNNKQIIYRLLEELKTAFISTGNPDKAEELSKLQEMIRLG
jgi:regulator of sirC expression with transglutaminase-like and TPR domain